MPYIKRDDSNNIYCIYNSEQISTEAINVSSAICYDKVITITLETPYTLDSDSITTAVISGANEDYYNGKFAITKVSDTQFTYNILKDANPTATGNIQINFAIEFLQDDNQEILDFIAKQNDFDTIKNKKEELNKTDYKVITHNEEVMAGIPEEERTLTPEEFTTLHNARAALRAEILALEEKYEL